MIKDIVLAVNCRSNVLNLKTGGSYLYSLYPLDYRNLPRQAEHISVVGAEPFAREDLSKIIRILNRSCTRAQIDIITSGHSPCSIKRQIERILKFRRDIGISVILHGYGKIHDKISNFQGSFALVLETLRVLKEIGIHNLEIVFNLSNRNIGQLKKVYGLSRELGVGFQVSLEENIRQVARARKELNWLVSREMRSIWPKTWKRAYFAWALSRLLKTKKRILPDYSGRENIFIDALGNIYPSANWNLEIGKLQRTRSWETFAKKAQKLTNENKRPADCPKWTIFTARPAIRKHWLKVNWWIIRRKFLYFESLRKAFGLLPRALSFRGAGR